MRNRLIIFIFIFTFIYYSFEALSCDYSCNNQGYCENGRCKCTPPWDGPDCSILNCPTGFDWGGNHTEMVQCSGRGLCSQGVCKCYDGFIGVACQVLACPTAADGKMCSGHGKCLSVKQKSKLSFSNWKCPAGNADTSPPAINLYLESDEKGESWDANRIFGCECEGGYTGYDCSIKKCPLGAVNKKSEPDTTSYLVNPLEKLDTSVEVTKHDTSAKLIVPAKWSLFIKNCEDSDSDDEGSLCRAHNITVNCNITLMELRDVIRKDGIVNDVVIYSDQDCDRLSCKGDINIGTAADKPDYIIKFVAGLVQVIDDYYHDKTLTPPSPQPQPSTPKTHIINGKCLGRYKDKDDPSNPSPPATTADTQLSTIVAHKDKMYMECSGLSRCTNGMCENCNVEEESKNSYVLKEASLPYIPNVRNCQVSNNDHVNADNYCNYGGIMEEPDNDEDTDSHKHCICNKDYKGHMCDVRTCKDLSGKSFYSYAYENNKGHKQVPCSGEGNCESKGCNCRTGFVVSCGNKLASWMVSNPRSECSGRGTCLVASEYITGYEGWDKDSIGTCDCYDHFTGYNCELRKCPVGPDPLDYSECKNVNELPGSPFIDIYDDTNQLTEITGLHFFSINNDYTTPTDKIDSIEKLDKELKKLNLEGQISYYKCKDSTDVTTPKCSESIELGDGTNGKWLKLSSSGSFPTEVTTHLRIYFHYYCVEDLRQQTIRSEKESYIRITAKFGNDAGVFNISEGRIPCYECSNQGICDRLTGVCKCLGRYRSSSGVDENGNINLGRRGDCSYMLDYIGEPEV